MSKEIWKDIEGFENHYQVSNLGNVRSLDREIKDSIGRKRFFKGKILSKGNNQDGYPMCKLWGGSKGNGKAVHRLVAETFIPNTDGKAQVNHIDGVKENNNIDNLEWVTISENALHAFELGLRTVRRGSECNLSKLNKEEVLEIRRLKKETKLTQVKIAEKFNISEETISQIVNRKRWAWLK